MHRWFKTLFVLTGLLIVAEGVLRWGVGLGNPPLVRLDPATEYELIGPAEYHRWGNGILINAVGMRAPEIIAEPGTGTRRVLIIGDSVIYGGHFIDQSETVAAFATAQLTGDARLTGCERIALPIAASSWGPVNQAAFLDRSGTFGAQAAGIVVSAHDLYDTPQGGAEMLPYRTSAPLTAVQDAVTIVLERLFPMAAKPPVLTPDASAAQTRAALSRMTTQLRAAGVEPILFYHPTISERQTGLRPEAAQFEEWATRTGLRFVNMGRADIASNAYRDDIHPNAVGAAKLANIIVDAVAPDLAECG